MDQVLKTLYGIIYGTVRLFCFMAPQGITNHPLSIDSPIAVFIHTSTHPLTQRLVAIVTGLIKLRGWEGDKSFNLHILKMEG